MTTIVTILAIALALFLIATTVIAMRYYCMAETLRQKNKRLIERIDGFIDAEDDCNAFYVVRRITDLESEYYWLWAVCRTCFVNGTIHNTCIKVFFDNDDDFNKREAEELCEMLNSK